MINGYFYYILKLEKYPFKLSNSNILQTVSAKNIDNLPTIDSMDILSRSKILEISEFLKINNEKFDNRHYYTADYVNQFYDICQAGFARNEIEQLYKSITKSLSFSIKQDVVKSLIFYHPFFSILNYDERLIYTFFIELKMFNGESLFVIIEQIPNLSSENISNYKQMKKYVNNALHEVKQAYWKNTENYNYPLKPPQNFNNTVMYNYILKNIIYRSFGIDLSLIKGDTIITYFDEQASDDIITNRKTRFSLEFNVDDSDCLFTFINPGDYYQYLDISACKTMPIIIINYFISNLNNLITMKNQTLKSSYDIQFYLKYILKYLEKEKLKLPLDVQNIIDTHKKNIDMAMSDELIRKFGLLVGSLISALKESP